MLFFWRGLGGVSVSLCVYHALDVEVRILQWIRQCSGSYTNALRAWSGLSGFKVSTFFFGRGFGLWDFWRKHALDTTKPGRSRFWI